MPPLRSHISLVQTPVNAAGKNSSTVFFLPKLSLNFTSTRPDACFDLSVKSGALEPALIAINVLFKLQPGNLKRHRHRVNSIKRQTVIHRYGVKLVQTPT